MAKLYYGTAELQGGVSGLSLLGRRLAQSQKQEQGQAGGGLVQVTVKGSGQIVAVKIDPKVIDPSDPETLQDLIVGALDDAATKVTELAQSRLGPLAGGMGDALGLPGF